MKYAHKTPRMQKSPPNNISFCTYPLIPRPCLPSSLCRHLTQADCISGSKSFLREAQRNKVRASLGSDFHTLSTANSSSPNRTESPFLPLSSTWAPGNKESLFTYEYVFVVSMLCPVLQIAAFTAPECLRLISSHLISLAKRSLLISFFPSPTRKYKCKHFICTGYLCCKCDTSFLKAPYSFTHLKVLLNTCRAAEI